ncbi:MAG: ribonuclease HII [Bdellovibrionaceae bacterium]|nr:ribonuclease HII [Pseudobdellovibrionaceae bacterium]
MSLKTFPIYPWDKEQAPVVGVDEAGRGCLAGSVCAGAVILGPDVDPLQFTDSKLLSAKERDRLYEVIVTSCKYGVGLATAEEVDAINIHQASLLAMRRALESLKVKPGCVLVDGKFTIPQVSSKQVALIKGELRASPIAAASIIAKVTRDRMLLKLGEEYPQYGFEIHKGYATEIHRKAIADFGPTKHHRFSFAGVREHVKLAREACP